MPPQAFKEPWLFWAALQRAATKKSTPSSTYCCSSHAKYAKHTRMESYGSQKPFRIQESKQFLLCLLFFPKYSTLNHSEAPCRKAKARNGMNWTTNVTNPPALLDRKACRGSPLEKLLNTHNLTLLSRNQQDREHLSHCGFESMTFSFLFFNNFWISCPTTDFS